jgi:hypothetical protein
MKAADRLLRWLAVALLAVLTPLAALAEDDPPGRVGRIADMQGSVSLYDNEQGQWVPAPRNRPLTTGDRLSTDDNARVEVRVGSTTLRLGGDSELEVLRLDDERVSVQLHSGQLALRVRSREVADETEVITAEAKFRPLRSGHFRIDRIDDTSYAGSWRGELRVDDGGDPFTIDGGRYAEIWREGSGRGSLRHSWAKVPDDDFADWVARDDKRDERSASNRYVSPEMTGAEDLDRNGRWEQHPEFGAVWIPITVQSGWAPYRYGHWAWVRPWGWTWVDDAPWGFAPFHYGRWVSWSGRWCWYPGTYVRRPVYAPAMVAWVGGPNIGVSVTIGGPSVGWVPLAPREVYVPSYRVTPVYRDRINRPPPGGWRPQVPGTPIAYGNQGVPNAVTVVPREVLERRQPVARAVVDLRGQPVRQPVAPVAAPVGPGGVMPAPVRRDPADDGRPLRFRPPVPQQQPQVHPQPEPRQPQQQQQQQPQRPQQPQQPQIQPPVQQPQIPGRHPRPDDGEPRRPPQREVPQPAETAPQPVRPQPQRPAAPPVVAPAPPQPAPPPVVRPVPRPPEAQREPQREPQREEGRRNTPEQQQRERGNPRERDQNR